MGHSVPGCLGIQAVFIASRSCPKFRPGWHRNAYLAAAGTSTWRAMSPFVVLVDWPENHARVLRHSTIRVTLDTYTQAVTTQNRNAQEARSRGRAFVHSEHARTVRPGLMA